MLKSNTRNKQTYTQFMQLFSHVGEYRLGSTQWAGWVGGYYPCPQTDYYPRHQQTSTILPPSPHLSPPLHHLPTLGLSDQRSQTISEMGFSLHEQAAPAKFLHCWWRTHHYHLHNCHHNHHHYPYHNHHHFTIIFTINRYVSGTDRSYWRSSSDDCHNFW